MTSFRMSVKGGYAGIKSKHAHGQLSSTVTRLGAGRSGVRIPAATRVYSVHLVVQTGSGAQPSSYSTGAGVLGLW